MLVVAADPSGLRAFSRLIANLPGAAIRDDALSDSIDRIGALGRLAVDDEVGIEFTAVPAA